MIILPNIQRITPVFPDIEEEEIFSTYLMKTVLA
jgi:hypothetical protein